MVMEETESNSFVQVRSIWREENPSLYNKPVEYQKD